MQWGVSGEDYHTPQDCAQAFAVVSSRGSVSRRGLWFGSCSGTILEDHASNSTSLPSQWQRFTYAVRIISKFEFVVQKFWADSRFKSPCDIRLRMLSSFQELLPETMTFSLGFFGLCVLRLTSYMLLREGPCLRFDFVMKVWPKGWGLPVWAVLLEGGEHCSNLVLLAH